MRVENCSNDIFAVGDCAEKRDFLNRKLSGTMLASTAFAKARVAGMNLYELSPCKMFAGTIAIYNTAIGDSAFGTVGIIESKGKEDNFSVVCGNLYWYGQASRHTRRYAGANCEANCRS